MTNENCTVDLGQLNSPILVGRDNGLKAREALGIDRLSQECDLVNIHVPDKIYSINSSFFLEMFRNAIAAARTEAAFFEKYQFDASTSIQKTIRINVARALREAQRV